MNRPPIRDLTTHDWPWVSPRDLAAYLKVHERTIRRMIETGALHAYRVGRRWHIPIDQARAAFPQQRSA